MAAVDYQALAAKMITRPQDMDVPHRFFFYAKKKIGKTTMCISARGRNPDSVLIMDPEVGTARQTKANPNVWPIASWQDVIDQTEWAKRHVKDSGFKWLAYDGIDKIAYFAIYTVAGIKPSDSIKTSRKVIKIQDYGTAADMIKEWLDQLNNLGVGIILTAQEKDEEIKGGSDEDDEVEVRSYRKVPAMPAGVRGNVEAWADVNGRLYAVEGDWPTRVLNPNKDWESDGETKVVEIDKHRHQRRLWIAPHTSFETGYRSQFGELPNYLTDPTVPKLVQAMKSGV